MRVLKITELASVSAGTAVPVDNQPATPPGGSSGTIGPGGASISCPAGTVVDQHYEDNNTSGHASASGGNAVVKGSATIGASKGGISISSTCKASGVPNASTPPRSSAPRGSSGPRSSNGHGGSSSAPRGSGGCSGGSYGGGGSYGPGSSYGGCYW